MSKYVVLNFDNELCCKLLAAMGVEPDTVSRLVLDFQVGSPAKAYLETFADSAVLDVDLPDPAVRIVES